MFLAISLLIAILFWVFIFFFFTKRANNYIKKFDIQIKNDIEKNRKEIQLTVSRAIEESVKSLLLAEQKLIPQLQETREKIEASEKRLSELLQTIKIKKVVREELRRMENLSGQPSVHLNEYYKGVSTKEAEEIVRQWN